jgi:hypothetical protein
MHRAFGWGDFRWAETSKPKEIAAYFRSYQSETLLIVNNLSSRKQSVDIKLEEEHLFFPPPDLFTGHASGELLDDSIRLQLPPNGYLWLKLS